MNSKVNPKSSLKLDGFFVVVNDDANCKICSKVLLGKKKVNKERYVICKIERLYTAYDRKLCSLILNIVKC